MEPPPFQEAARCDVCKCGFNTFRRRHHCRCCGRTLCHEHSSDQLALPQFAIYSPVRVCAECFNDSSRSGKPSIRASSNESVSVAEEISSLSIGEDDARMKTELTSEQKPALSAVECKCGMPLCICEAPVSSTEPLPMTKKSVPTSVPQSNPRPKKSESSVKSKGSTSSSKPSSAFNWGQSYNGPSDKLLLDYEVSGEGLREAIKNGDIDAVKKLLTQGVDANYHDKQGSSLLHLAAVFNQTEIAFALMEGGASLNYKNAQGETPVDCAPVTLQFKMREKMKEEQ